MSLTDNPGPPPGPPPGKPAIHHTGFGARIRNYFLTGLVVAGPLAITVWLTWSFITWADPRHWSHNCFCGAYAARLPDRQPGGPQAGRGRRAAARPHAAGAFDL